jgi:DNA-binding transcriptional MerR regulator
MPYREKETIKLFYTIGEVATMFNVNTSLIRFWEKEFDIIRPRKNKKGNRLFTTDDIDNFKIIYHLVKEKGFTLSGAKNKLKEKKPVANPEAEILRSLNTIRSILVELRNMV